MTEPSGTSSWTKLKEAALPISLTYGLVFLGLWFILIPAALTVSIWGFYAFGLVAAVVVGLLTRRFYRQVVLERGDGYCVLRIDYVPWLNRARAKSEATADSE
jgi:hypothetical protein